MVWIRKKNARDAFVSHGPSKAEPCHFSLADIRSAKIHRFFVEILSLKLNHCGRFHQNMIGLAAVPCQIETRSGQV